MPLGALVAMDVMAVQEAVDGKAEGNEGGVKLLQVRCVM